MSGRIVKAWAIAMMAALLLSFLAVQPAWAADSEGSYYYVTTDSGEKIKKPVNSAEQKKDESKQEYITLVTDSGREIKRLVDSTSKSTATKNYLGDEVIVSQRQIETGKIDLENMLMKGSSNEKLILIERSALEYAAQNDMTIGIVTNYMKLSVPAKAIKNCAEFTSAANSSSSFNFIIEINDAKGLNNSRDLPAADQGRLGVRPISAEGFGLNLYFRGSNNTYTYIDDLDTDIHLEYNYLTNYRGVNRPAPEQTLAFVWVDCDRRVQSTKTLNALLPSRIDTENTTLECYSPYACGAYTLVTQTNADNRKTTLKGAAGNTDTAAGLTGAVNTKSVPAWAADSVAVLQAASVVPSDLSGVAYSAPITRGEFAAYLVRTLRLSTGGTALTAKNPFTDVKESNPYYMEILTAANSGLVAGKTANTFAPDASITRQEMAVLFNRAMQQAKVDFSVEESKLAAMSDAAKVADWAKGSVAACLNGGLIAGKEGNRFAPTETTTWCEAVVMLARLYNVVK